SPRHAADRLADWATAPSGAWSDPFAPAPPPPGLASATTSPRTGARAPSDRIAPAAESAVPAAFAPQDRIGADAPAPRAIAGVAHSRRAAAARPRLSSSAA